MTLVAAAASPSPFERRLARAGGDVRAVAILLEQACGLLRELVCVTVWVPKMLSRYATCAYSWIRLPSRSLRRTRIPVTSPGERARPAGGRLLLQ
jgi:hypothetical protein